jgi:hypothetical protein
MQHATPLPAIAERRFSSGCDKKSRFLQSLNSFFQMTGISNSKQDYVGF